MKSAVKWAIFAAIAATATVAFILIAGDDNPAEPLPFSMWLTLKIIGVVLMAIAVIAGRKANKYGLLTDMFRDTK